MPQAKRNQKANNLQCHYCGKVFIREVSYTKHACISKLRFLDSNLTKNRLGFQAYQKYYDLSHRSKKNLDDFIKSRFYNAFVKFGKFVVDNNVMYPDKYVEFLIRTNYPVDRWTNLSIYEIYLRELAKKESFEDGTERTLLLMKQWADEYNEEYYDFFRKINPNLFVHYVKNGRISPWVLYNCDSGIELLETKLNSEQLKMIEEWLDPDFWARKMKINKEDRKIYSDIFKEYGL